MKKLIWLALLLPMTANASWEDDLCDDIGWTHPLCSNIQTLAEISAGNDEALEAEIQVVRTNLNGLSDEHIADLAFVHERIDALEAGVQCYYGVVIPGGHLLVDGVATDWYVLGYEDATSGPDWNGVENTFGYHINLGQTWSGVQWGRLSKTITAPSGVIEGTIEGTCLKDATFPAP